MRKLEERKLFNELGDKLNDFVRGIDQHNIPPADPV
jgi:hypothetical protein